MVGSVYFINMPYSNFTKTKGRPVLVYKKIDKNDLLILPLTSNLDRDGFLITNEDIEDGQIKKKSVIIVPKLTAVDATLIIGSKFIASLKQESFEKVKKSLCKKIECS